MLFISGRPIRTPFLAPSLSSYRIKGKRKQGQTVAEEPVETGLGQLNRLTAWGEPLHLLHLLRLLLLTL